MSTNVIGDHCSFQDSVLDFAFFFGESSLAVNIWIEDVVEHIAALFVLKKNKETRVARGLFFLVCGHRSFWKGFACIPFLGVCYANSLHNVC